VGIIIFIKLLLSWGNYLRKCNYSLFRRFKRIVTLVN